MSEYRELAGEVVVDADDFFLQVRRCGRGAGELIVCGGRSREDSGIEQRGCVSADHATRNHVAWEVPALNDARRSSTAGAVLEENRWGNLGRRWNLDWRRIGAEVTAVRRRIGHCHGV